MGNEFRTENVLKSTRLLHLPNRGVYLVLYVRVLLLIKSKTYFAQGMENRRNIYIQLFTDDAKTFTLNVNLPLTVALAPYSSECRLNISRSDAP